MDAFKPRVIDKQKLDPGAAQSPWLTAAQAVVYLAFPSKRALYQAVRRGQVPARRLGSRRMRFHRDDLDRLLIDDRP